MRGPATGAHVFPRRRNDADTPGRVRYRVPVSRRLHAYTQCNVPTARYVPVQREGF